MKKPPHLGKSSLPVPYEVGYGKPPAGTRFRKGQSGNPKGRPKGARNRLPAMNEERLKSIVIAEAYRGIKVNDGDRQVTLSMAEAILRSIALKAAKGDHRSQKLFSDMLGRVERSLKQQHDEWLKTAIDYKVDWERELDRRRQHGIVADDPIPHPGDIEIDFNTGGVVVKGPFSAEEHRFWMELANRRDEAEQEIAAFEKELQASKDRRMRRFYEQEIWRESYMRDLIVRRIGLWPNRDPVENRRHRDRAERNLQASQRKGREEAAKKLGNGQKRE